MTAERIPFDFDRRYRFAGRIFGITPASAHVELDDDRFVARFGPWKVETERSNIRGAGVTGPYALAKTIGAAHLSFADRGLTFATNPRAGACLSFRTPVTGIDPFGAIRHPGLTVTVADPGALVEALTSGGAVRTDVEQREEEQRAVDDLHTMTASELRTLAEELGLPHTARMSKRDLVDLVESAAGPDLVDVVDGD